MPEFPLPSFGPHVEDILGYAMALINMFDEGQFLWLIAAFSLIIMIVVWAIRTVRNPPRLDI